MHEFRLHSLIHRQRVCGRESSSLQYIFAERFENKSQNAILYSSNNFNKRTRRRCCYYYYYCVLCGR